MVSKEDIEKEIFDREIEQELCERSLEEFCKASWHIIEPGTDLRWNWHISTVCGYLEAYSKGTINRRLIINIPPGTLKSILVSVMYPAWAWIDNPERRYLTVSNEQGLSTRDARRMKQIITSEWFQSKWPLALEQDQNEKTLFANEKRGFRQAVGVSASNTGKRGDDLIMDDLIAAKDAFSDVIRPAINLAFDQELSTRVNDPVKSGMLLIMQRLHENDITGHLLKKSKTDWTHLSIPMKYEGVPTFDAGKDIDRPELNDPRTKKGELLFPTRFTEEAVAGLEEDLGEYGFAGQMQQRPVPSGGGILKSHWWRMWPDDKKPPSCEHVFLSYDTAFSEKDMKNAAYSAMTRWGVFWHEERDRYCLICLGVWYERVGYDALRKKLIEFDKEYDPDCHLIEKKATGISLIQDMKRAVPTKIRSYSPGKGEDKISRAHSVSPMFESGLIYIPNKAWAIKQNDKGPDGLIEYIAKFPNGEPPSADLCFIAGTMISTNRGKVPIEQINSTDKVLTPMGWRNVNATAFTGVREVVTNHGLTGTANHPIFTFDKGYINLDTVTQTSKLLKVNICDFIKIALLGKLSSTERYTEELPSIVNTFLQIERVEKTSQKDCMSIFGSTTVVKKLKKGMRCIILMAIRLITTMITLSAYRAKSIVSYLRTEIGTKIKSFSKGLGRLQLSGIGQMKVENGIGIMQRQAYVSLKQEKSLEYQEALSRVRKSAIGAVLNLSTRISGISTVALNAKVRKAGIEEGNQDLLQNTLKPVYNLSVDYPHCYFANDILVHNCDTVTQACIYLRAGYWVSHPDDPDFEDTVQKKKRKAAYG